MRIFITLIFLILSFSCKTSTISKDTGIGWQQFENAKDAGFNPEKLEEVKKVFIKNGGDVLLILRAGKVVLSIGDVTRSFRQASIRKSYLHALYGTLQLESDINIDQSLAMLNIDDVQELSVKEKQATVRQLMASRSGIYLPAAYSPGSMIERLPERGSSEPGQQWFYNNWDFNALGEIFKVYSKRDLFEVFHEKIANPLGMEDFSLEKTTYVSEPDKSRFPAYLFRMSARDMAKFGQLYLNKGTYNGQQIITEDWIDEGFKVYSANKNTSDGLVWDDYGLLWWISNKITSESVVYASGTGNQRLVLFPDSDMLMVHLVDSYQPKMVAESKVDDLIHLLLAAKDNNIHENPKLTLFEPEKKHIKAVAIPTGKLATYIGTYKNSRMGTIKAVLRHDRIWLETQIGNYKLQYTGANRFINADMLIPIAFQESAEQRGTFRVNLGKNRTIEKLVFFM